TTKKVRIICRFKETETVNELEKFPAVIGRFSDLGMPELDLTPDTNVSRKHARLTVEEENLWIEDLGSRFGTKVNGDEIKERGKQTLKTGDVLQLGDTMLEVTFSDTVAGLDDGGGLNITVTLDAKDTALAFQKGTGEFQKKLL